MASSDYMSPSDRDYAIRTMIGEAGNQSDEGLDAVGSVIMNRVRSGKYGDGVRGVVLAPSQFEPWSTRSQELLGYSEDSPEYKRAAAAFDKVMAKDHSDPTSGATHFLNEKIVRERRNGSLPKWASGPSTRIGDHTFYGGNPDSVFDEYSADSRPAATTAQPGDEIFDEYSGRVGQTNLPKVIITGKPPKADFNERMVSAMPVVGPLFDKATAAAGAAIQPFVGDKEAPKTFGERYDRNLKMQEEANRLYGEEHPIAATAADVVGTTLPLMAMGGTPSSIAAVRAPVAAPGLVARAGQRMMGMRGNSLGSRVYQGAGGMAAIETGNQLLKGNDPRDQGILGPVPLAAVGGAVGPAIGEGITQGGAKIMDMLPRRSGPLRETNTLTRQKLIDTVEHETPASMAAALERHGDQGMLMDLNQGTRDVAGGLADIPGPHKGEVREALRAREAGSADRLQQSLDQNTVPHVDIRQLTKTIDDAQAAAADPLYRQFRETSVHPTQEIKDLIPRLKKAKAFRMADELAGISGRPGTEKFFTTGTQKEFPTAETWDYVKRGLDRRISSAIDGGDKELYRELVKLKKDMLTEIEKTEGGKVWKQAREAYAEYAEMKHQIEEGQKIWKRSTRVDDLAEEVSLLSNNERAALQQGARDAIQDIMDATRRGDTRARDVLMSRQGRKKLELLFGERRAGKLLKDLEAEVANKQSRYDITGNSETSSKQARRNALLPQEGKPGYLANINVTKPATLVPEWMTPQAIMEGRAAARYAKSHEQLGRLLQTSMGGPEFRPLVDAIRAEGAGRAAALGRTSQWGLGAGGATTAATPPLLRNRLTERNGEKR